MRSARVLFFVVSFFSLALFSPKISHAQISTPVTQSSPNSFTAPNTDPNVPRNQHTYAQAVTIEVLSAVMCQLVGIDPVDPKSPCLGINPQTHRLGYAPQPQGENIQVGGLLGTSTDLISMTYRPIVTTGIYTQYLSDNFGIVKKTYAASPPQNGYGFEGLKPIFELWKAVRNIAYALLVFAFVFIGLGIMLRVKIDPRTVMTIQNQIPKVIVAIILITFSYAISALLVDLMWVSTYAGVNLIVDNTTIKTGDSPLSERATKNLLEIPLIYTNNVFYNESGAGIFHLTRGVSSNIGTILRDALKKVVNLNCGFNWTTVISVGSNCALQGVITFFANIVIDIVIFVVLIVALFKIWFNLLKAYIYTLVYIIVAPIMIVFGLLPSKPMGFENWLRRFFVNIAVFPLTAFLIVGARALMDVYDSKATPNPFIPPLIGHTAAGNFGALLAFGVILIAPHLQTILQEKMGIKGIGSPGLVSAGIAGGAAVVGAPVGRAIKHLNRTDSRGGKVGSLAVGKEKAGNFALSIPAKLGSKYAGRKIKEREFLQSPEHLSGAVSFRDAKADIKKGVSTREQAREAGNSVGTPRSWLSGRSDARETRREERRTAGEAGTTTPRRSWNPLNRLRRDERGAVLTPRALRKPVDTSLSAPKITGTGGAGVTGGAGGAATAAKAGGASTTSGAGSASGGPVTLTGPVTLAHPVPIPHSGSMGSAKKNLVQDMYGRYKTKTKEYGDKGKQNITVHIEKALEGKGPEEINKLDESKWKELVQNAEHAEENGGGSTGGAPKA